MIIHTDASIAAATASNVNDWIKLKPFVPILLISNLFSAKNNNVDLGKIYLKQAANDLGNVTVTQSPVQMKKDTIEFTASAFKTKPNVSSWLTSLYV